MFGWQNQTDLLNDVVDCSSFVSNAKQAKKFNYFIHNKEINTNGLWYESDEEVDIGRGRGRLQNCKNNFGTHLDVVQDIQMQVRNTVGNCYHNDAIESYLRVNQNMEEPVEQSSCSEATKVIVPSAFSKESSSHVKGRGITSPIRTRGMRERSIATRLLENSLAKETLNINDKHQFPML